MLYIIGAGILAVVGWGLYTHTTLSTVRTKLAALETAIAVKVKTDWPWQK
jgi:hypothetical protein